MTHEEFDRFLDNVISKRYALMTKKSADYSTKEDKLANFKQAGRVDGISSIEALRGMWLKHRVSVIQGLDDLIKGKMRSPKWGEEKLGDEMNYNKLLTALITERFGTGTPTCES